MKKSFTSTFDRVRDEIAEGAPSSDEIREPSYPAETTNIPVVKTGFGIPPVAETGLLPAVVLTPPEGKDDNDDQDSSRTTAEIQAAPFSQKVPQAMNAQVHSVLIIEDTTELAEVIQATLERMNLRATYETHGGKAMSRYEELHPDVVLLDIGLPDMSGWKFLEALKDKYKDNMPIVIVITAYGDPANRLVGKLHGVWDYLIKPFTPDEVERIVKTALEGRAG